MEAGGSYPGKGKARAACSTIAPSPRQTRTRGPPTSMWPRDMRMPETVEAIARRQRTEKTRRSFFIQFTGAKAVGDDARGASSYRSEGNRIVGIRVAKRQTRVKQECGEVPHFIPCPTYKRRVLKIGRGS